MAGGEGTAGAVLNPGLLVLALLSTVLPRTAAVPGGVVVLEEAVVDVRNRRLTFEEQLDELGLRLAAWQAGDERLREEYERLCATIGREVRVDLPGGRTITGTAQRIDDGGRLVVDGTPVAAGDVVHARPLS